MKKKRRFYERERKTKTHQHGRCASARIYQMNMISGSVGISGAVDTNFVLMKDGRAESTGPLQVWVIIVFSYDFLKFSIVFVHSVTQT